jgi:hypothetical protein
MPVRAGMMLRKLLSEVRELTAGHGQRAGLAKLLKVSSVEISQWLLLRRAPNGEITLRLLDWVQAEKKKQQKALGSVSTTAKSHQTRSTHSRYEKRKTSPKRR